MAAFTDRRAQTALAIAVAAVLCWAGLTFRPRRSVEAGWPTVTGATFPKRVRLPDGDEFELPAAPQRVVLASATVVDFATALIGKERVAAVCSHAFTASALAFDPQPWRDVVAHDRFTAEIVLACRPDLVLCNDYNDQQTALALRRAGVPVLVLPGPTTLADCARSIDVLGQVLGVEAKAAALQADLTQRVQAMQQQAPSGARPRALCFTHNPTGSWTGGVRTLHHEAILLAGLDNAAALGGIEGHAAISTEQILALDPDLLIVDAPVGAGRGSLQFLRENPTLSRLRALVAGHVVELPAALYSSGSHHVVAAAEAIAAAARKMVWSPR